MAKITLIDDSPTICRLLTCLLRYQGHEVTCLLNPKVAITHLLDNPPDLAILDFTMPEIDGIELLRQMRKISELKTLKVVMYSAVDDHASVSAAMRLGALEYLRKTMPWENVYARIALHLPLPPGGAGFGPGAGVSPDILG